MISALTIVLDNPLIMLFGLSKKFFFKKQES